MTSQPCRAVPAFFSILAALLLAALPGIARAQVVVNSAQRTIGVSSASGNASDSRATTGVWNRTLSVPAGVATLESNIDSSGVSIDFNYTVDTAPPDALPVAVLQCQVEFNITANTALTLTRSQGPAVSANFSFSGPGIVIGNGTPPGLFLITPGVYTLQYAVNGFAPAASFARVTVELGAVAPSSTAFTYQGRLERSGSALPTSIDVWSRFYTGPTGIATVPGTSTGEALAVPVSPDGLFTVQLDPGIDLPSSAVYLELGVRPAGEPSYTYLAPRTLMTPAPKARRAAIADAAVNADFAQDAATATTALGLDAQQRITIRGGSGTASDSPGLWLASPVVSPNFRAFVGMRDDNAVGFYGPGAGWSVVMNTSSGNLGAGTDDPQYRLHASSDADTQIAATSTSPGGRTWALQSSAGNYGPGSQLNGSFQLVDRTATLTRVLVDSSGNVGVGTAIPAARLDVNGGIRAGSLTYAAPVASSVAIGDAHWRARLGGTTTMGLGNGGVTLPTGDPLGAIAAVDLPNGATITGFTVYVVDNDATSNIQVYLARNNFSVYTTTSLSSFSAGASTATQALSQSAPPGLVADNQNHYFVLFAFPVNGTWTPSMQIRGASVSYTLPRPAQ